MNTDDAMFDKLINFDFLEKTDNVRTERCFSANGRERERTNERQEDMNQESTSKLNMSQSRYMVSNLGAAKVALSKLEKQISVKLAYEWKQIYRMLVALEEGNEETVDLVEFDKICQKFNVSLSNEEIVKIRQLFCVPTVEGADGDTAPWTLNYKAMSQYLGLHKDSFNFLHSSRNKTLYTLKQSLLSYNQQKEDEEKKATDLNMSAILRKRG